MCGGLAWASPQQQELEKKPVVTSHPRSKYNFNGLKKLTWKIGAKMSDFGYGLAWQRSQQQ